jgi:hypothetical protein
VTKPAELIQIFATRHNDNAGGIGNSNHILQDQIRIKCLAMGGQNAGREGTARGGSNRRVVTDENRPGGIAEVRAVINEGAR